MTYVLFQASLCLLLFGRLNGLTHSSNRRSAERDGTDIRHIQKRQVEPYNPSIRTRNGGQFSSEHLGRSPIAVPETPPVVATHHTRYGTQVCPQDNIRVLINGVDCPAAIDTVGSYLCYKYEHRFRSCCEKCVQLRNPQKPGCEYGDQSPQCKNMNSHLCYERQNREICCETCPQLRKVTSDSRNNCEYGDMSSQCKFINPSMCYRKDIERLCCETCPTLRNQQTPECPYGDHDSYLCGTLRLDPSRCYLEQTRQICCNACGRLRLSIPGCTYGDHRIAFNTPIGAFGCEQFIRIYGTAECKNPTIRSRCCASCHGIP